MSKFHDTALEVIGIMERCEKVRASRDIAHQKHQLAEKEFEQALKREDLPAEEIESGRQKLVELYGQHIDSCLALRTVQTEAEKRLEQISRDHSK